MFVILNKDGTFYGAMSVLSENFKNTTEFDVGKVKDGEPFNPQFNYTIVDSVAIRGEMKPIDIDDIQRIEAEIAATKYQRDRVSEYPSIVDQLDVLYHGGYDAWRAVVQAVKEKYPKPGA
jgi:hypothetical protein